jgi:hypothetical protein
MLAKKYLRTFTTNYITENQLVGVFPNFAEEG